MKIEALVILAMALVPRYALAVDGQILINQSTVMAAGGFPYTISQPGSYKLSGNLSVPAGVNGIIVNASNVVLDLNGFSMTTPPGSAQGVLSLSPQSAITIRNGSIVGFSPGVYGHIIMSLSTTVGWTLQDLFLSAGGGVPVEAKFGPYTRILNVTGADHDFLVECPSIVIGTVADAIEDFPGALGCTFSQNATVN